MYCPGTTASGRGPDGTGVEASRHAPTTRTPSATARAADMMRTWGGDDCRPDNGKFCSQLVGGPPWVLGHEVWHRTQRYRCGALTSALRAPQFLSRNCSTA